MQKLLGGGRELVDTANKARSRTRWEGLHTEGKMALVPNGFWDDPAPPDVEGGGG
jgi:hypothetical protein